MFKISPCIETIFTQLPFFERFKAVKECNLNSVDMWGFASRNIEEITIILKKYEMIISSAVVESNNPESIYYKNKLLFSDNESINEFYLACKYSIEIAKKLNIPSLIVTVGQERNDITRYEQHTNIILNLKNVSKLFEQANITLIVEPLNITTDHRGYYLYSTYESFSIIKEVNSSHIKLLYDVYHQQLTDGNIIENICKNIDLIGHFHVADVPGRHELGSGELNYKNIFKAIKNTGYNKYIGLEYIPLNDSKQTILDCLKLI